MNKQTNQAEAADGQSHLTGVLGTGLPVGKYRTRAGSEMTVSAAHGGISRVEFDWVEEQACFDCTPEPYADEDGFLIWHCDECGGGCAALVEVPNS